MAEAPAKGIAGAHCSIEESPGALPAAAIKVFSQDLGLSKSELRNLNLVRCHRASDPAVGNVKGRDRWPGG
jgi:hypothetical protein